MRSNINVDQLERRTLKQLVPKLYREHIAIPTPLIQLMFVKEMHHARITNALSYRTNLLFEPACRYFILISKERP